MREPGPQAQTQPSAQTDAEPTAPLVMAPVHSNTPRYKPGEERIIATHTKLLTFVDFIGPELRIALRRRLKWQAGPKGFAYRTKPLPRPSH